MTGHEHWDEQAAAYALDALDDDERAEFEAHLADCDRCRGEVDSHALVAAQLGALAGDDEASTPPPWSAMRGRVVGAPSSGRSADVVVLRPRRPSAWLAAAAAVVVIAAGVTTWQVTRSNGPAQPLASVAACEQTSSCHVIALRTHTGSPARVLVDGDSYSLVSTSMPAPPAGHVWALWQITRSGGPVLLSEFDSSVSPNRLKSPYDDTVAFAVSKERAGTTPAAPSAVVASGRVV